MPLEITVVKTPENVASSKNSHIFTEQGGSMGRSADSTWVLDDPERYISSKHVQIVFEAGQFYLVDTSTNGTFMSGASEPIGNGNRVALNDGDHFVLSDYEFAVKLTQDPSANNAPFSGNTTFPGVNDGPFGGNPFDAAPPPPAGNNQIPMDIDDDELFGPSPGADGFSSDPFRDHEFGGGFGGDIGIVDGAGSLDLGETDPLKAFDKAGQFNNPVSDPFIDGNMAQRDNLGGNDDFIQDAFGNQNNTGNADALGNPFTGERMHAGYDVEEIPTGASQSDHGSAPNQAIQWPNMIPEDWNRDPTIYPKNPVEPEPPREEFVHAPVPTPPPPQENAISSDILVQLEMEKNNLLQENKNLKAQLNQLQSQLQAMNQQSAAVANSGGTDLSVIAAMGLGKQQLTAQQVSEINTLAGKLMRETIAGMMQALGFRKKIKEEFRINVTTIQPVENNPLKFSANIEDALENMFIKKNKAYKRPIDAVREGFQGIAEHQVAVLAGIQAAFRGMVERLDPDKLEQQFEKYRKAGIIKMGQKGKNWDSYIEFHKELSGNMDNSFQLYFGYDFVQAYEDQLQRLAIARKNKSGS